MRRTRFQTFLTRAVYVLLVWIVGLTGLLVPSMAQNRRMPSIQFLPGGVIPPNAVHQVTIETPYDHLDRDGYQTFRFEIQRLGQSAVASQDEVYYVSVEQDRMAYRLGNVSLQRQVVIPKGQTSVKVEVEMPIFHDYYTNFLVLVTRDGSTSTAPRRALLAAEEFQKNRMQTGAPDLTVSFVWANPPVDTTSAWSYVQLINGTLTQTFVPTGAVLGSQTIKLPTVSVLARFLNQTDERVGRSIRNQQTINLPNTQDADLTALMNYQFVSAGPLENISESWTGMQALDVIVISAKDLEVLANLSAQRCESLRQWVAMGGCLVVTAGGADFQALPSILPNMTAHQQPRPSWRSQAWAWPVGKSVDRSSRSLLEQSNRIEETLGKTNDQWNRSNRAYGDTLDFRGSSFKWETKEATAAAVAQQAAEQKQPFVLTDYVAGRIAVVPGDLSDYQANDWALLFAAMLSQQAKLYENIGPGHIGFESISRFEVPDVGEPPRFAFLALITLFALMVGPVAFVFLNMRRRINLVLVLVPVFSFLSALSLFLYVVIEDGFAFRTNRLSFTYLDSRSQSAMVHSTSAIFSGVSPGNYELDRSVGFFDNHIVSRSNFIVKADSEKVRYSGGDIRVRTKHQVSTLHSVNTAARLVFIPGPPAAAPEKDTQAEASDPDGSDPDGSDTDGSDTDGSDTDGSETDGSAEEADDTQLPSNDSVAFVAAPSSPGTIKNFLGCPVRFLIVRTANGLAYAKDIPPDGVAQLLLGNSEVEKAINEQVEIVRQKTWSRSTNYLYNSRSAGNSELMDGMENPELTTWGRLSFELAKLSASQFMSQRVSGLQMKVGQFYAFCDESPWAIQLKPVVQSEREFHIISGRCEMEQR